MRDNETAMPNEEIVAENGVSRVNWSAAGALAVAAAVGLFLYADGYFDKSTGEITADTPAQIIEAQ